MTAVIYARYSSDNQREESIEGQIRECTAYAEKKTVQKEWLEDLVVRETMKSDYNLYCIKLPL